METPDSLIVPMQWAVSKEFVSDDRRHHGHPMTHRFLGTLRQEQPRAVDATLSSLRSRGAAVLSLNVGGGKTCCALNIACELKTKTLVLVHKQFLADQWAQRISHFVPGATVSRIQGNTCDTSGDFVIAMLQTLLSRQYSIDTFASCGTLIVDECQHIAAKMFSQVMFTLNMPYTLGLTATPSRRDGLERVIHYFLGPISYFTSLGTTRHKVHVNVLKYSCDAYAVSPPVNTRGDVDYTKLLSIIASNAYRTEFIADLVSRHLSQKDVLVLSHRRAHCETLVKSLIARGLDAALYIGGVKDIPTSKILVSSYAYVSEGFDEPRLECLVLATPSSDVAQTVGRILRGDPGDKEPVIYDIVDTWSVCYAQAAKRRKQYLASNFIINQM
jgi:superfamily II DNA or RNA helicase